MSFPEFGATKTWCTVVRIWNQLKILLILLSLKCIAESVLKTSCSLNHSQSVSHWKFLGRMAELAEDYKINRQLLIKIFFEQLWKVDQKTKVAHYFDNSNRTFFSRPKSQMLAKNEVQIWPSYRGSHLSALDWVVV